MQLSHYLPREVPDNLQGLAVLAVDLRWSWNHGADELWRAVAPELWDATANPWVILEHVSNQRLVQLSEDESFLRRLREQLDEREQHLTEQTWFSTQYGESFSGQVAYFSMEYGISESLPIYSGGLGVLAGDYLKTGCDLGVPLVGIGLLYQRGYFRQSLDPHGEQLEFYPYSDPTMLPILPLRGDDGEWIHVSVDLPGRELRLTAWLAEVGRRQLLLLDSNDVLNDPGDRGITSELYGGSAETRLQQEIVLGIGGWRLLEKLGIDCPVCHLNEGHAAFALLERARQHMLRTGASFRAALRATRAGNLFTTHTPVAAGFDRFSTELMRLYFKDYAESLGVGLEQLLALGRANTGERAEPFNMAYLAVRGAGAINGVSRLHGEVSRRIFQPLFPRWPRAEVPVGHVTNGVHVPSWDSAAADALWTKACGQPRWRGALETVEEDLRRLDDQMLWQFRARSRGRLVAFVRERVARQRRRHGMSAERVGECAELLDPDALTLGFARRFAEYKRTNLLLHDPRRLLRILENRDRPVQLVIAGKAHPEDAEGQRLLRQWQEFIAQPDACGRVVFIEDYDLIVAGQLTQGVDLWVNTPRRPWEASGTSGMKVLVNGGLNLSELDGWWAEAFRPEVGWAIGDRYEHEDHSAWDALEAEQLYRLLETDVIPSFYERDERGLPSRWIARIRESMAWLTTRYSSNRMLREYMETYYAPLNAAYRQRNAEVAENLEAWAARLAQHWHKLHFGNVSSVQEEGRYEFDVQVYLDELPPGDVCVQLYAEPSADETTAVRITLRRGPQLAGTVNGYVYQGAVAADRPVTDYTPRVIPAHDAAAVPLEENLILWHR
jgi:starch phosphorylase